MLIKSDVEYGRIKNLSPNIQKFLKGIDNGTAPLNYSLVDKLSDGSAFRIVQGLRSMAEQYEDYKKGRRNVSMAFSGSAYALGTGASIENAGKVVTYAFAGQSYHNYGLAWTAPLCRKINNDSLIIFNLFKFTAINLLYHSCSPSICRTNYFRCTYTAIKNNCYTIVHQIRNNNASETYYSMY